MNFDIDAYQNDRLNQHHKEQDRLEKLDEELEEFLDTIQDKLEEYTEELILGELSQEHLNLYKGRR